MPKVFDQSGKVIEASSDAVLNDLTKAPVHETMPDGQSWIPIVIPTESGLPRIVLIDPALIATSQRIDDIIQAVNVARQGLVDQLTAAGLARDQLQENEIQDLVTKVAQIALTPGPPGKDGRNGVDGKDGLQGIPGRNGTDGLPGTPGTNGTNGTNGKDGLPGAKGADGAQGLPGKDGVNGTNGTNGVTPTIALGNVTSLAAGATATVAVRSTGTNAYAIDFGIPAGAKGAAGTNGTNGADGAKGTDGIVPTYRGTIGGSPGANTFTTPALVGNPVQLLADVVTDANGLWSLDYTAMGFADVPTVNGVAMGGNTVATSPNISVSTKTITKATGIATKPVTLLTLGLTQVAAAGVTVQLQITGRK